MITKAENLYREPLLELQLRLDELTNTKMGQPNNPFGPSVLCESFRGAIEPLRLNSKVSKQVYFGFKEKVLNQLEPLYKALNISLAKAGILPDLNLSQYLLDSKSKAIADEKSTKLKRERKKSNKSSGAKNVQPTTGHSQKYLDEEVTEFPENFIDSGAERSPQVQERVDKGTALTRKVYGAAHQLLQIKKYRESAIERHIEGEGIPSYSRYIRAPKTINPVYSPKEVITALTALQGKYGIDPLPENPEDQTAKTNGIGELGLLAQLDFFLSEKNRSAKEVGAEEAEAIEILERLFDSIASNAILSDEIKPLMNRLLVPTVKVLMMDSSLLTSHNHPVRQVLNYVARLGLKGAVSFDESILYAEWAVSDITENFDTSISVFRGVLKKLEEMIAKQEQVYQRNVSRVTETCEGQDRIEKAKMKVDEEIELRLGTNKVPQLLLNLLEVGWRELLLLSYLRQGDKSKPWLMGLQIVEQLFLQLTLKAADHPPASNSSPAIIPEALLKLIKNGLSKVPNTESLHADVLLSLEECLLKGTKKPKLVDGHSSLSATPRSIVDKLKRKIKKENDDDNKEVDLKKWSERALRIEIGEWVAFGFPGKEVQRARLAWVSESRDSLVFVNHQGLKVIEQTLDELATNMSKEIVWSIAYRDLPIVDQGLDAMVQKIYDQLAYETTHDQLTGLISRKEFKRSPAPHARRPYRSV